MRELKKDDVKDFTLGVEYGCFIWKTVLKDNSIHQIKYRIEPYITPKGNKSKRKHYFIRVNDEELFLNEELKKWFMAFRVPYLRGGI